MNKPTLLQRIVSARFHFEPGLERFHFGMRGSGDPLDISFGITSGSRLRRDSILKDGTPVTFHYIAFGFLWWRFTASVAF